MIVSTKKKNPKGTRSKQSKANHTVEWVFVCCVFAAGFATILEVQVFLPLLSEARVESCSFPSVLSFSLSFFFVFLPQKICKKS